MFKAPSCDFSFSHFIKVILSKCKQHCFFEHWICQILCQQSAICGKFCFFASIWSAAKNQRILSDDDYTQYDDYTQLIQYVSTGFDAIR